MGSTTDTENSRPPVIGSQLAANKEIAAWLKQNDFQEITDHLGNEWQIDIKIQEHPDVTMKTLVRSLHIQLTTTIDQQNIVDTGLLSQVDDERLLKLIGDSKIPLYVRWSPRVMAEGMDLKFMLQDMLPQIKSFMQKAETDQLKRSSIYRFIDHKMAFTDHNNKS